MPRTAGKQVWSSVVAALVVGFSSVKLARLSAGQNPRAGAVTGVIDGAAFEGDPLAGMANLDNEPAVDRECHDANGGKHRFRTALPNRLLRTFQSKKLYIYGIARAGNIENALLAGSGKFASCESPMAARSTDSEFFNVETARSPIAKGTSLEKHRI
jgi:hypothetical protein